MKKVIGYVFILTGLISLVSGLEKFSDFFAKFVPFVKDISQAYLSAVGVILILVGLYLSKRKMKKGKKDSLLPIFEGEKVVGYKKN